MKTNSLQRAPLIAQCSITFYPTLFPIALSWTSYPAQGLERTMHSPFFHSPLLLFVEFCLFPSTADQIIKVAKSIELYMPYRTRAILPIIVFHVIRDVHGIHLKFFSAHHHHYFSYLLSTSLSEQRLGYTSGPLYYSITIRYLIFSLPIHSIPVTSCSILQFTARTPIAIHDCTSIPFTFKLSTLPRPTYHQSLYGSDVQDEPCRSPDSKHTGMTQMLLKNHFRRQIKWYTAAFQRFEQPSSFTASSYTIAESFRLSSSVELDLSFT